MHADPHTDLARERPVVLGDLERRELRPARRERERDQLIARREVLLRDAPHVVRMLELAVVPPRRHVEVRCTVCEYAADAALVHGADHRVGVLGSVLDVRPVEQRRDAGLDRSERAHEIARVPILRTVGRREHAQDVGEVFIEKRIRGDVAQDAFPDVAMSVDESRHYDHRRRVDDLGLADLQVGTDRDDLRAVDQDVRAAEVADLPIHRENTAVLEYCSSGCHNSPLDRSRTATTLTRVSSCPKSFAAVSETQGARSGRRLTTHGSGS